MAPLVGLLGTLTAAGRILSAIQPGLAWGPVLAGALAPLTAGVALAIVALLAFDGLTVRVEGLAADLDRIGAETIDAIALATPVVHAASPSPISRLAPAPTPPPSPARSRSEPRTAPRRTPRTAPARPAVPAPQEGRGPLRPRTGRRPPRRRRLAHRPPDRLR